MEMSPKMKKFVESQVKRLMATGLSYEEAFEVAVDDWRIDHPETKGERLEWEPTLEEEKAMRKAAKIVGEREVLTEEEKKAKRKAAPRKEDVAKRKLIQLLFEALGAGDGLKDVAIDNPERVISFKMGGESYSVSLTRHRPPKSK